MTMTMTKPLQGQEARDTSPEAFRGRIAQFCGWFEVEPVAIKTHAGRVRLSDELLAWSAAHGANLDWLMTGKLQPMAGVYRATEFSGPLHQILEQLEQHEQAFLIAAMKRVRAGEVTLEAAMAAFGALCDQHPMRHGATA